MTFFRIVEDITVVFVRPLIPTFRPLLMSALGFKATMDLLLLCLQWTHEIPLVEHLLTVSMAAKLYFIRVFVHVRVNLKIGSPPTTDIFSAFAFSLTMCVQALRVRRRGHSCMMCGRVCETQTCFAFTLTVCVQALRVRQGGHSHMMCGDVCETQTCFAFTLTVCVQTLRVRRGGHSHMMCGDVCETQTCFAFTLTVCVQALRVRQGGHSHMMCGGVCETSDSGVHCPCSLSLNYGCDDATTKVPFI